MRRIAIFGILLLLTASVIWIASGGLGDPAANVADAGNGAAKAIKAASNDSNDLAFSLDGSNTTIQWTGSNSIGQTPTGFFYDLTGTAVIDSSSDTLSRLELNIDMNSVKAMASALTEKLKHKGFFEVDKFPNATFISTNITNAENHENYPDANYIVEGNFQLRDVTQSIKFPLKVEFDPSKKSLQITSQFSINRKDYGVVYSDSISDRLIRNAVLIDLSINTTTQPVTALDTAPPESEAVAMPLENFTETIKATLVEFDMVLVPGDESQNIAPFWIGKTEVTWEQFDYWALCRGLDKKDAIVEINQKLRPSAPHNVERIYRGWGRENQPAVGMSRLSAELFCKWLSQQTGKQYRLPTSAQWNRAYELGGGELAQPLQPTELEKIAWFANNALSTDDEGFDFQRAMPVGQLQPNKLDIHDMLGNVAEWVHDSDGKHFVCGGHFKLTDQELTADFREAEDQSVWNKDYPQDPKSIWWYVNADYVGFRVICQPN